MNTIITEETEAGEVAIDVYSKLSNNRILFITGNLTNELASDITATLLLKDQEDPGKKITLFINSYGGYLRDAFMILDMMRLIQSPIETICVGSAFQSAAMLLAAGTPGLRYASKNSVISVGQLENESMSSINMVDAKKMLDLVMEDNARMMKVFAQTSGKTIKQVMKDFDRAIFMTPAKAVKYGLIDRVAI